MSNTRQPNRPACDRAQAHTAAKTVPFGSKNAKLPPLKAQRYAGGGGRDRTDDLKLAKLALFQLSYAPSAQAQPAKGDAPDPTPRNIGASRN